MTFSYVVDLGTDADAGGQVSQTLVDVTGHISYFDEDFDFCALWA